MKKDDKPESKKPYEPPRLAKVKIRVDELVLSACKMAGAGGPGASCLMGCSTGGS